MTKATTIKAKKAEVFEYTPDTDIIVHPEGVIRQLCAAFQSHENGLPEWPKNAADEYARRDLPPERRIIVLVFKNGNKAGPPAIACLDFCGITAEVIDVYFRWWGAPEAAQQGGAASGVQGGHGNGGKCYMNQMFEDYAFLHTVSGGRGSRYGIAGGETKFGYIPGRDSGRDYEVEDHVAELEASLRPTGCNLEALPKRALDALNAGDGFTLVCGIGPRGYKKKVPVGNLIESLEDHPQMIQTLEFCDVFVVVDGKVANGGAPLSLPEIEPLAGGEEPRVIDVPLKLKDPTTGERVVTTDGDGVPGKLILKTSRTSMRWSKKNRHSVIFQGKSGYIGYVPVTELDIQSPFRDRIHGVCQLPSLEAYKQNDRGRLAESPLTRGVQRFISYEIQKYAEEFEIKEKRKHSQKEKNEISRINEALDRWKNKFLSTICQRIVVPPPPPPLPAGTPHKITLSMSHRRLGMGVSIRPKLRFLDSNGRGIKPVPFRWVSEDTNVAMVAETIGVISSFFYGTTTIYAETLAGGLRSNRVSVEVVPIQRIQITPESIEAAVGGRTSLQAVCTLASGIEASDVQLLWTEDDKTIAGVSASGLVYGRSVGETCVEAADDKISSVNKAVVRIVEGDGDHKDRAPGYPKVLVSGDFDRDPITGEHVNFSSEDPPVWQQPADVDNNVWWINSSAPLAQLYLDRDQGYGYDSREWRMYHLERYIDVIVQITMMHEAADRGEMLANEWIMAWGAQASDIQAAALGELSSFIGTGELPTE